MMKSFRLRSGCQNRLINAQQSVKRRTFASRKPVYVSAFATDEKIVAVQITVPFKASFGEHLKIVGASESLGQWNTDLGVLLNWTEGDNWTATVDVPANTPFEYKIVYFKPNEPAIWEHTPNRHFTPTEKPDQSLILTWASVEEEVSAYSTAPSIDNSEAEEGITPPFLAATELAASIASAAATPIVDEPLLAEPAAEPAVAIAEEYAVEEVTAEFEQIVVGDVITDEEDLEEQVDVDEIPIKNQTFINNAVKTAGAVALGVAGAAVLSAFAIDVADTAILGAVAAAAGGAILSPATSSKKSSSSKKDGAAALNEVGTSLMDGEEEIDDEALGGGNNDELRITGAGQPGVAIAAGILSAFDAGKSLVESLGASSSQIGEEEEEE